MMSMLNNPFSSTRAPKVKNFLAIGSYGLTKDLHVRFLTKFLKIKEEVDSYEKSLFLVFSGNDKDVTTIDFYLDQAKFASLPITTLAEVAKSKSPSDADFNKLCINKTHVESFANDY